MSRLTIALTGGIGSGKSTVSALFAQRGVAIIDADEVSHALTAPGGAALSDIAAAFGEHLIDSDDRLDRAKLRGLVFADPKARQRLEHILHPRIRAEMQQQLSQATSAYAILAIPLLFETGQHQRADRVLVIDLPEALQLERVQARSGLDEAQVRRMIASQIERNERLAGADDIIDNSGPAEALEPQVTRLHQQYLRLASQHQSARSEGHD